MRNMQLNLLVLRTKDIELLANFYKKLGLDFTYHRHGKGPFHYSSNIGDLVFEIYPFLKSQIEADASLRLGFEVADLDELIETLKKENIIIVAEPKRTEWGYVAIVKDLDGRKIELTQV